MNRRSSPEVLSSMVATGDNVSDPAAARIDAGFERLVQENQDRNRRDLGKCYDYIVCGGGAAGCVVAARLAEDGSATVLLVEAGGDDAGDHISRPPAWLSNLGSARDWAVVPERSDALNGRAPLLSAGKVLGGGSSINAMIWARGHREDWDGYAREVGDSAWNYASILRIYRQIEDWHGVADPRRGKGGRLFVQPAPDSSPLARAMLSAADISGVPVFEDANGAMMETSGGASLVNLRTREGRRLSIYRSYLHPMMARRNLTVLTGAMVRRLTMTGATVTGVELEVGGVGLEIEAGCEVVLSLGALHTPKVLMLSGIGEKSELGRHGIEVRRHLPGVGRNLQDHVLLRGCVWSSPAPVPFTNNGAEAAIYWKSDPALSSPDIHSLLVSAPVVTEEVRANHAGGVPPGWSLLPALVRPKSRGRVLLAGSSPSDPARVCWGALTALEDLAALASAVEFSRSIGNAGPLADFRLSETLPGPLKGAEQDAFIRNAATSYWHQSGTARMGLDEMAVVDSRLRVNGVSNLRIADASIFPSIPTGNTMAPTVIVAERAAEMILADARRAIVV